MTAKPIIAVIGAGLMGHGIAQVFASRGHEVAVFDPVPEALETLRARIGANLSALGQDPASAQAVRPCRSLADAVAGAGLVIEAAREQLEAKRALFAEIEANAPASAILATNTSVIPIGSIMAGLARPERALGTHWWNPPHLIPLVEVIGTDRTAPDVISRTMDILAAAGKTPVHVRRDVAGFIGNRLQHALWREAVGLVEAGVCDAETVDMVVKASFGMRLAVLGPLENADLVGTDLTLAIHETILPALNPPSGPSPYLGALVAQGRLGMRTGEGFRQWTPESADAVRAALVAHLKGAVRAFEAHEKA